MTSGLVSIIIPTYNEEKYIKRCLDSVCKQSYDLSNCEILIVDGGSTDKTIELVKEYKKLNIKIIENKKRLVTYAVNLGIENSQGEFIIRMDAHAEFDEYYVENCIKYIQNGEYDNVGGVAETKGIGFSGEANADILSSKFGVGNSKFRVGNKGGLVDTVPFGTFKREIFDRIGLFDVELPRSEDNDFNSRIRKNGGKVFLSPDIKFIYYCRDSFGGLLNQGLKNGNALFLTLRKNPKAMSLRHFIPFCFVLSLIVLPIISIFFSFFWYVFLAEGCLYTLLNICFSFSGKAKFFFYKLIAYPLFHITYGFGSFLGLLKIKLY